MKDTPPAPQLIYSRTFVPRLIGDYSVLCRRKISRNYFESLIFAHIIVPNPRAYRGNAFTEKSPSSTYKDSDDPSSKMFSDFMSASSRRSTPRFPVHFLLPETIFQTPSACEKIVSQLSLRWHSRCALPPLASTRCPIKTPVGAGMEGESED